jgi:lysophospholipase L1-like esterase
MTKIFKLLSIQILIALACVELLLNLFLPFPDPYKSVAGLTKYNKYLPAWNHYDMEPPYTRVAVTGPLAGVSTRKVTMSINRFGFLYDESVGHRKTKDELRIAVVGGSTVECAALENKKRWPNQLQQYLANWFPGKPVTVLNMGIGEQDTRSILATVTELGVKLDLNYMVFMLGANDLFRTREVFRPLTDEDSYLPTVLVSQERDFLKVLATRLQLVRGLRLALHRLEGWSEPTADESIPFYQPLQEESRNIPVDPNLRLSFPPEALDDYESNLISLFALASAHGITPIFTTQPMLWKPIMTADEEAADWLRLGGVRNGQPIRMTSGEAARTLETLNLRLMSACQERGWRCIDLASKVPRSLDYFFDSVHFNEAGAEFVAKEVGQFLSRIERTGAPAEWQ